MLGLVALSACGDDATQVEARGPDGGSGPPIDTAGPAPATGSEPEVVPGVCRVSPEPTGPIFDPDLQAAHGDVQPGQRDFDWDGDGEADVLRFEPSTESVVVDHGAGTFRASGVPSDFDDVLYGPPVGRVETAGPDGPPSPEAFREGRAGPTPAAVGDFTGDGRPDLAVITGGDLIVHATSTADATGSATRDPAAPATAEASWVSPRTDTDLPFDEATVVAVGDVDGDGIGDVRVDSYAPRAFVSAAFYLGQPCRP